MCGGGLLDFRHVDHEVGDRRGETAEDMLTGRDTKIGRQKRPGSVL